MMRPICTFVSTTTDASGAFPHKPMKPIVRASQTTEQDSAAKKRQHDLFPSLLRYSAADGIGFGKCGSNLRVEWVLDVVS